MPNVKLCREGKALYHKDAIQKYGADVVNAVTPFAEGKAHIPGHPDRHSMWHAYLIADLEEMASAKKRVDGENPEKHFAN